MAEIQGLDQALKNMRELAPKLRLKAGRRAVGKGAAVVRKKAKANALRVDDAETGRRIADNIGQRFRSKESRRTGNIIISVGVLSKRGKIPKGNPDEGPKGNTPHWHLIEMGTANAKAQPFLRPAASESVGEVYSAIASALGPEIDKEVAKLKT